MLTLAFQGRMAHISVVRTWQPSSWIPISLRGNQYMRSFELLVQQMFVTQSRILVGLLCITMAKSSGGDRERRLKMSSSISRSVELPILGFLAELIQALVCIDLKTCIVCRRALKSSRQNGLRESRGDFLRPCALTLGFALLSCTSFSKRLSSAAVGLFLLRQNACLSSSQNFLPGLYGFLPLPVAMLIALLRLLQCK